MPDRSKLLIEGEIGENLASWCKSVVGGLHYYARGVRYDISHAVSRIAQTVSDPQKGTVEAIEWLAGYLRGSSDFALLGRANHRVDRLTCTCDAGHKGDNGITSKSQSGVIILLNGVPVCWRSNRQCDTSLSPAEGEIYALSVGVKDSR